MTNDRQRRPLPFNHKISCRPSSRGLSRVDLVFRIRNRIIGSRFITSKSTPERAPMPTALREGPYRFFFVSFDCNEPTCGHVRRDDSEAKIWLEPIEVAFNHGFPGHELRDIQDIIVEHHSQLMEAWYEHCGHRRSR